MKTHYKLMSRRNSSEPFTPDRYYGFWADNRTADYGEALKALAKARQIHPEIEWCLAATSTATVLLD